MEDLTREFVAESQEGLERMELCLTELERRPGDGELLSEIFRTVHTIKGTTGFLGFQRLRALAHAGESLLVTMRDGRVAVTSDLVTGTLTLVDGLRQILLQIETTESEGDWSAEDDALVALLRSFKGEASALAAGEPASPNQDDDFPFGHVETPLSQQKTLRIGVDVLNRMMNLVGELVLTRNQIVQSSPESAAFPELARRLDNVTAELRESVMRARMQPLGHLFAKFPRMVRDLAKACGRQVRIEFEGQETGLDKSLLDAIRDPLTHAVRNAVDHGIEPPGERVHAGKPAEGMVRLRAFQQNGSVIIEVIDDGRGISPARVLTKAIERKLVTPEQAASISERDALQLIFVPGFSTAATVTDISGRGVGMDVVRNNVEQVGGSVDLESHAGAGTTVRIRVPLTLAIVPALLVQSGGQSFAVPQSALVELVHVPARDSSTAVERIGADEVYRLRDSVLPLIWLDRLLELEPDQKAEPHSFYIAVLESEGRRFGLAVDQLRAPEEIVVKPLPPVLSQIGMFSGATVLGNGMLAMILDVAAAAERAGVRSAAEAPIPCVQNERPLIEQEPIEVQPTLVIYESWKRGSGVGCNPARIALPLKAVERIERVPLSEIEYADGRPVWPHGGELVPLEDEDEVLIELRAAPRTPESPGVEVAAMATVLICVRPGAHAVRRVGVVVRRVVDVSAGTLLAADPELCAGQLAMAKDSVATLHPEFAEQAGELQEVA